MIEAKFQTASQQQQLPPELLRSTPRDVVLTAGGRAVVIFSLALVAGAIGLGVWLSALATRDAARLRQMQNSPMVVSGEVTSVNVTHDKDRRRIVRYRYEADGTTYTGRASLPMRGGSQFQVGSAVEIGYVASQPRVSWIRGHEPSGTPAWVPLVAPLSLLMVPLAIRYQVRRQRRLLEDGRPAIARVTAIKRVQHQHGQNYRVSIEFHDMSGALRTGRFDQVRKPSAVGADIVILYDPEERKRLARYPMSLVRVRVPF